MTLNNLKPHIYYDEEDVASFSEVETDVDSAVEDLLGETAESKDETNESETTFEEPTGETSDEETQNLVDRQQFEALQEKYKNSSQEGIRLAQELKSLKSEFDELKSKGASVFGEEQPEPEQEESPFDTDEYDRIYIEEGAGPAALYMHRQIEAKRQNEQITHTIQEQEKQSEQFNQSIAMGRAKELFLREAQKEKNDELIKKYKDQNYVVSVEELQNNDAVFKQWNKEAQYVIDYFRRLPIKVNGEVKSYKGKYPADAFKQAYRALNYDNDIEKTQIETAETTANLVSGSAPKVKSLSPSGGGTADARVKVTGRENYNEARTKTRQMPDTQLDELLQEAGL